MAAACGGDGEAGVEIPLIQAEEEEEEISLHVPYHSGPLERFCCFGCKTNNVEVRLFHNPKKLEAHYLCRNCKEHESSFSAFLPVTFQFRVRKPSAKLIEEHQAAVEKLEQNIG